MPHSIKSCSNCLLTKENRCMVFYERSNPIFDKNGDCIAKITNQNKLDKLIKETDWDEMR